MLSRQNHTIFFKGNCNNATKVRAEMMKISIQGTEMVFLSERYSAGGNDIQAEQEASKWPCSGGPETSTNQEQAATVEAIAQRVFKQNGRYWADGVEVEIVYAVNADSARNGFNCRNLFLVDARCWSSTLKIFECSCLDSIHFDRITCGWKNKFHIDNCSKDVALPNW